MPFGFGGHMPTADSPYAHMMKESNELKLVSVQALPRGINSPGAWLLALPGLSGGSWCLAVA